MGPEHALPLPNGYQDAETYVNDLIDFVKSCDLLQLLCGGVHILDFFTREPDLYQCLLPREWREYFELHDLQDLLDLVLHADLEKITTDATWRGKRPPPATLLSYLSRIRSLALKRDFDSGYVNGPQGPQSNCSSVGSIPRHVAVGMKEKKLHEVDHFVRFVDSLAADVELRTGRPVAHVVDFGSGQNYLGRTLASPPFNRHVIALESRRANVEEAKAMDVHARLASKPVVWRNKKKWRAEYFNSKAGLHSKSSLSQSDISNESNNASPVHVSSAQGCFTAPTKDSVTPLTRRPSNQGNPDGGSVQHVEHRLQNGNLEAVIEEVLSEHASQEALPKINKDMHNSRSESKDQNHPPNLMVVSLHSCGNLTHHGLRSLMLNPSVSAVALVGCCYNLVTERLCPPTYKLPNLRPVPAPLADSHNSLSSNLSLSTSSRSSSQNNDDNEEREKGDPHGFPMSNGISEAGISLNITARMMAVQAPHNWSEEDSDRFFTRHFYRALLQKIFLDRGVVEPPSKASSDESIRGTQELLEEISRGNTSNVAALAGSRVPGGATQPIIIGNLRKALYKTFTSYVRGAVEKLASSSSAAKESSVLEGAGTAGGEDTATKIAELVCSRMSPCHISDEEIEAYETKYAHRKKQLSLVWTLMAYSATLVEAIIVVDRWLWLREHMSCKAPCSPLQGSSIMDGARQKVGWAWVQSVFEYSRSPRNLAIVGIKG